mgnify:CR=1 FL=1
MIENAIQIICVYAIPLIFAITLHEAAHGWAAKKLGDDTAWILGRVTANPVPHIDPVGTVLVPGALVLMSALTGGAGFVFGWAKPVPINPRYFRHFNRDMMLTALAGPASNLLQAIGWTVVLKLVVMLGISERFVISVCAAGISVNLMLMAFNLIPIPPLDGSKVLFALLSDRAYDRLMRYEKYGMGLLMALLVTGAIDRPLGAMRDWLLTWLNSLGAWGYTLPSAIF